jgi:excisionase family DNA binding protein
MAHALRTKKNGVAKSLPYVLTLSEAAALLRLQADKVEELVAKGELPGRRIDREYRFLRPALEAWLQGTTLKRQALSLAGATAGDPYFPEILEEVAKIRKRTGRS